MQTLTRNWKTISVGLAVGLTLIAGAYADMGHMDGPAHNRNINKMGLLGRVGPMMMSGNVIVNGKAVAVQSSMAPTDIMGNSTMGEDMMDHPLKMGGTITMKGHTYRCTMIIKPQGK